MIRNLFQRKPARKDFSLILELEGVRYEWDAFQLPKHHADEDTVVAFAEKVSDTIFTAVANSYGTYEIPKLSSIKDVIEW